MKGFDLHRPGQRFRYPEPSRVMGQHFNNNVHLQRPPNFRSPSHIRNVPFTLPQTSFSQVQSPRPFCTPAVTQPFPYNESPSVQHLPTAIPMLQSPQFLQPHSIFPQFPRHPHIQNFENKLANNLNSSNFRPRSFTTPQRPLLINNVRPQNQKIRGTGSYPNGFSFRQDNQQVSSNNRFTFNGSDCKQKKKKIKERSLAFFCEACDRGWNTEAALNKHTAEHVTCGLEGCKLTAHPKVIEKHIQLQHATGLFKRISVSYKPEDIEKWISDRKSRFPTKDAIEKKQLQKEEMAARGEVEPKNNRFNRQNFNGRRDRRQFPNKYQNRRKRRYQKMIEKIETEMVVDNVKKEDLTRDETVPDIHVVKEDSDSWRGDLPKFPGTAAFPNIQEDLDVVSTAADEFSDDEWQNTETALPHDGIFISQALTSLCGTYASDSEEEKDEQEMPPTKKYKHSSANIAKAEDDLNDNSFDKQLEFTEPLVNKISENEVKMKTEAICGSGSEDEAPEELPYSKPDHETEENVVVHPETIKKNSHGKTDFSKNDDSKRPVASFNTRYPRKRRRLTLLERLLNREITHERNVILQCVRYTVQNDFFNNR